MALLAIIVGGAAGLAAGLLKDLIGYLSEFVKGIFPADEFNWLFLILPVIGVVLCGIYCRYIVKDDMEFGTERILGFLRSGNYRMPRHLSYAPIIACSLTLGFGGSAGAEGPIAYTGAGIGSNVGKYFGLSDDMLRLFIIIGASAGIAGIFKAPVGGAMFALEVLAMPITGEAVIALMFACLSAGCVAYAFSGFTIDIAYLPKDFFRAEAILGVIVLGLFCALYSMYYSHTFSYTEKWITKLRNPWVKNIASGLLIGGLTFLFPVLYGEGYGVLGEIINGNDVEVMRDTLFFNVKGPWMLIVFVLGILLVKGVVTSSTNSGGGVGGDFAPTLFAGCMAGLLFAYFSNHILGTHFDVSNFALFGMAGVMAGAIQAPLMAIFLTVEMVGDFSMFFPVTICATISFGAVRLMHHKLQIKFKPAWVHGLGTLIKRL